MEAIAIIAIFCCIAQWWLLLKIRWELDAERALSSYLSEWLVNVRRFTTGVIVDRSNLRGKNKYLNSIINQREERIRMLEQEPPERDDGDWWKTEGWEAE